MSDKPILDSIESKRLRDEGITKVAENGKDWHERAVADLVEYLRTHGPALTEVWRADYVERGLPLPHSENAWGAVASHAAKRGLIGRTGRFRPSQAKASHGRLQGEWKYTADTFHSIDLNDDLSVVEGEVIDE